MQSERHRQAAIERLLEKSFPSSVPQGAESCLDPESLAAWTEGSLSAAESVSLELHLSTCARCQAMLATLVRSGPTPTPTESVWTRWQLRWLVPLTAAATAVALWVAIPDERRSAPAFRAAQEVAPSQAPPAPEAAAPEQARPPSRPDFESSEPSGRENTNRTATNSIDPSLRDETAPLRQERAVVPPAEADSPPAPADAPLAEERQQPAAAAQSAPSAPAVTVEGETPASAAAAQRDRTIGGRVQPLGAVRAAVEIVSPNPSNRWRVAAGGAVEFTTTGGTSWQPARVPPGTPVTGSAPQPLICWLVGPAGFVALTTDGVQFRRIVFPVAVDLLSVRASDASTAVVTTADQRLYRTEDAGMSWTALSPGP